MSEFDVFARFYDLDYGDFREDVDLYLNFARRTGSPVLEPACGTGRLLIPLAREGYHVTGVDVSPAMLAVAGQRAKDAGMADRIHLVEADIRTFSLESEFALAIVAVNSFLHLTSTEDRIAALRNIARHLRADGLLVLDLFNPDPALFVEHDGRLIHDHTRRDPQTGNEVIKLRSARVDMARQLLHVTFFYDEILPGGEVRRTVAPFSLGYIFPNEMGLLLDRGGFWLEAVYGSYDLEPYDSESPRLVVVARKR